MRGTQGRMRSTPDAETVAMDMTLRLLVLPLLMLLDDVFGKTKAKIMGETKAMLRILKSGRNPTMRHLERTHRMCVAWLHEQHQREGFLFDYTNTRSMVADIYTKSIPSPHKWGACRRNIVINMISCRPIT